MRENIASGSAGVDEIAVLTRKLTFPIRTIQRTQSTARRLETGRNTLALSF